MTTAIAGCVIHEPAQPSPYDSASTAQMVLAPITRKTQDLLLSKPYILEDYYYCWLSVRKARSFVSARLRA